MSAFALGLVLAAAFIHASWNYVLKRSGVGVAGLTGGVITAYSVWDKQAVAVALIPPLIFDWLANLYRTFILCPLALRKRDNMRVA